MKCPRKNCKNEATISKTYGVLPCDECQQKDSEITFSRADILHPDKLNRVQEQRDKHGGRGHLYQPYIGNKVNEDFFRRYPDKVKEYGVQKELEKL